MKRLPDDPSILAYGLESVEEEVGALRQLLASEWKLIALLLAGLATFLTFTQPLPPRDVYLAVGQPGSGFERLGRQFVPFFADEGIRLHLVNTRGSGASLSDIADRDVRVNAGLVAGGILKRGTQPDLVSLGSVEHVPFWIFYRGPKVDSPSLAAFFEGRRVAAGSEGSATLAVLKDLLAATGEGLEKRATFRALPHRESVDMLLAGEIDTVCLLDGFESPNVQALLRSPDVRVRGFPLAAAYVKKLRYLDVVTLPQGSLDLAAVRPEEDVKLLASTVMIVAEKSLHPAVQQLFMHAAAQVSNRVDPFFSNPRFFPAYVDQAVPLSAVAKQYLEHGPPPLAERLPVWLLSFVDRVWLLLLGAFAIVYPAFRLFPSYRRIHSSMFLVNGFRRIRAVELAGASAATPRELQPLLDTLDALEARAASFPIASEQVSGLYGMRSALRNMRAGLLERRDRLAGAAPANP